MEYAEYDGTIEITAVEVPEVDSSDGGVDGSVDDPEATNADERTIRGRVRYEDMGSWFEVPFDTEC